MYVRMCLCLSVAVCCGGMVGTSLTLQTFIELQYIQCSVCFREPWKSCVTIHITECAFYFHFICLTSADLCVCVCVFVHTVHYTTLAPAPVE